MRESREESEAARMSMRKVLCNEMIEDYFRCQFIIGQTGVVLTLVN